MGMLARRPGRKRKSGRRRPSGQHRQPEDKFDPKIVALRQPHRSTVPQEIAHDQKAECELGRIRLRNEISSEEYGAADWYRGVVSRCRSALGAPAPVARSVNFDGARPSGRGLDDEDEYDRRMSAYRRAYEAVSGWCFEFNQRQDVVHKVVNKVVIHDEPCPGGYMPALRVGLIALAVHRGFYPHREGEIITTKLTRI